MPTERDPALEELAALVDEIQARVKARHPQGDVPGLHLPLPDLMPLLHARDAAEAKVAAIGAVNPRPPGAINAFIQSAKRLIARSLGWFVRDQVAFNHAVMQCVQIALETFGSTNRLLQTVAAAAEQQARERSQVEARIAQLEQEVRAFPARFAELETSQLRRLQESQVALQRVFETVADGQRAAYDASSERRALEFRAALDAMHGQYRESSQAQLERAFSAHRLALDTVHGQFTEQLDTRASQMQERFWEDASRARLDWERLIHNELRIVRQRLVALPEVSVAASTGDDPSGPLPFDYGRFADRFRGGEQYVRSQQQRYRRWFQGRAEVVDLGCGRGEFLELIGELGGSGIGIDSSAESVAHCLAKGLRAEVADLFAWLRLRPEASLDGIFCSQVVEHLQPLQVPELIQLASSRLRPGGVLAVETPNPECLAIFATHFYLDPTHVRPVPPALLTFYYEECGLGGIEVERFAPAVESMPSLGDLPVSIREAFFGGLDYAIVGRRL